MTSGVYFLVLHALLSYTLIIIFHTPAGRTGVTSHFFAEVYCDASDCSCPLVSSTRPQVDSLGLFLANAHIRYLLLNLGEHLPSVEDVPPGTRRCLCIKAWVLAWKRIVYKASFCLNSPLSSKTRCHCLIRALCAAQERPQPAEACHGT